MKLLAALVLPALLVVAFFYVGVRIVGDLPQSRAPAEGVVWGKRTFANRAELGRWLQSRGMSYQVWARRHPVPTRVEPKSDRPTPSRTELVIGAAVLAALATGYLARRERRDGTLSDGGRALLGAGHAIAASPGRARWAATLTMRRHPDVAWLVIGSILVAAAALLVSGWS